MCFMFCYTLLRAETLTVTGTVTEILPIKGSFAVFLNPSDATKSCNHRYSIAVPDADNLLEKIESNRNNLLTITYKVESKGGTVKRCRIIGVSGHKPSATNPVGY